MMKKGLVCAIAVLFVGISIIPIAGSLSIERIPTEEQICKTNSDDDTTPPEISVEWEAFQDPPTYGDWYVTFIVDAYDNESGIDRVVMFINDGLHGIITDPGPGPTEYEFTIEWSKAVKTSVFKFVAYNGAGLSAFVIINGSDIKSYSYSQSSSTQQFTNPLFFQILQRLMNIR